MSHDRTTSWRDQLTTVDAANAIRAARLNALDLMDTAELLFNLKRFSHSAAFSILAIEEAGKASILRLIFLGFGGARADLWRDFRSHRAKTEPLNTAIHARIRVAFPKMPPERVDELAAARLPMIWRQ